MNKNLFFKYILCVFGIVSLASCDNDFNEIGTNIVGDDNFLLTEEVHDVVAYNQQTGSFQSNNLKINQLGIYDNPVFGKTIAHFVTQVQLETENPTIDQDLVPTMVSAILTIPYFNTKLSTDATSGVGTYELDSIYGPADGNLKLGIYESNKYINTTDGSTQNPQEYYSDQLAEFNSHIIGNRLNNAADMAENDEFVFKNEEQIDSVTTNGVKTATKIAPRMKLTLDNSFFASKLLSPAAAGQLVSNDLFKNYFRALHFKVEQSTNAGRLAMLNFGGGLITVKYTQFKTKPTTAVPVPEREEKSIVLKLTGNTVNLFELTENTDYLTAITNPTLSGDTKLYLKGGQGSMAVLELFKHPGELEALKATNKKWLINDASITFYIDDLEDGMGHTVGGGKKAVEPNRIYLYDLNNKTALLDYYTDSSISGNPKFSKGALGGIIEKVSSDPDARGTKYKIRLTNHIRNLIANDTLTNVRLGLVVTEDINDIINLRQVNKKLKTPKTLPQSEGFDAFTINAIPQMSGINPLGTVLWGTSSAVAEDKKIKLIIHYTKPN